MKFVRSFASSLFICTEHFLFIKIISFYFSKTTKIAGFVIKQQKSREMCESMKSGEKIKKKVVIYYNHSIDLIELLIDARLYVWCYATSFHFISFRLCSPYVSCRLSLLLDSNCFFRWSFHCVLKTGHSF